MKRIILFSLIAIIMLSSAFALEKYPHSMVTKYNILSKQMHDDRIDILYEDIRVDKSEITRTKYNTLEQLKKNIRTLPKDNTLTCRRVKLFGGRHPKGNLQPEAFKRECYKKPYQPIKSQFDTECRNRLTSNLGITYWGELP